MAKVKCGTCIYWERETARGKGGRISSNAVAPCLFEMPKLPESFGSFGAPNEYKLRWMASGYGQKCAVHKKI